MVAAQASRAALSRAPPAGYTSHPVAKVTATKPLTTVSGRGGDVLIKLPSDRAVGPITVTDCRDAVIVGGSIRALPTAKVNDQRRINRAIQRLMSSVATTIDIRMPLAYHC
ncbi:hypothetical protein A7K94_0200735 [Modestobacter sp. VKM Ac-2676]|nr:hypothetical protein A7K94_0200735 [Modestobacter sp. VKM Ac-2676]